MTAKLRPGVLVATKSSQKIRIIQGDKGLQSFELNFLSKSVQGSLSPKNPGIQVAGPFVAMLLGDFRRSQLALLQKPWRRGSFRVRSPIPTGSLVSFGSFLSNHRFSHRNAGLGLASGFGNRRTWPLVHLISTWICLRRLETKKQIASSQKGLAGRPLKKKSPRKAKPGLLTPSQASSSITYKSLGTPLQSSKCL